MPAGEFFFLQCLESFEHFRSHILRGLDLDSRLASQDEIHFK